ncbi:MAG: F0F1 ATP synthase subunit A [Planctomycetes bacterium]|nr:F0F1 ATP synthase subunit A [Planctomycetota bacterium]
MSAEAHPPNVLTAPLYEWCKQIPWFPDFLKGELGQKHFETIVFSGVIMVILVTVALIAKPRLKKIPGRLQSILEVSLEMLANMLDSLIGPGGRQYLPLLGTSFIFIFCLNMLGLIPGMLSPTANLNCTAALAIVIFIMVQSYGIKANGFVGYIKHLAGSPKGVAMWVLAPLMFPLHILGEMVKPFSLSLRLYGNISGEDTIILALAKIAENSKVFGMPIIPVPLPMMFFALFTSFLQAFIFTALACIYIMILTAHEEH